MIVEVTFKTPEFTLTKGVDVLNNMVPAWHLVQLVNELSKAFDAANASRYKMRDKLREVLSQ